MFATEINTHINDYVRSHFSKITVHPGTCRYNYQCHCNAVHDAIEHNEQQIALVVYFEGLQPIVHFVNVNHDGKFIDNTLGHWSSRCDYYLVRMINKDEFWDVHCIHRSFRNVIKASMPFYMRFFHKFDEI